jgi:inhibitor of KinA sporulation pathway (predicted exonuclease)
VSVPRPVVVFDLEYTAWEGSQERGWSAPGEVREIVEIGAVRLGVEETGTLRRLVRPVLAPQLSDYFVALTGITQERVEAHGVPFADALSDLAGFAAGAPLWSNGPDGEVVEENCRLLGLECPFERPRFRDVRGLLAEGLGRDPAAVDSFRLPQLIGQSPAGRPHDALADAQAVADALCFLLDRDEPSARPRPLLR